MAATRKGKSININYKLNCLKEHKVNLVGAVDEYVDKIVAAGNGWIEGGDNGLDYSELCQMIERANDLICDKYEEISGASEGVILDPLSQSLHEQSDSVPETVTQPQSELTTTSLPAIRQTQAPGQPADRTSLSQVLTRIIVMEEAMFSFRSKTDKVLEKQDVVDEQLSEISSKLFKSDQQFDEMSSQWSMTGKKLEEMSSKLSKTVTEQKLKKLLNPNKHKDMEARIESLVLTNSKKQQDMETMIESLGEFEERLAHVADDTKALKTHFKELTSSNKDITEKINSLENLTHDLSRNQDQGVTSLRKLEARLEALETGHGGSSVAELRNQIQENGTNFEILCEMLKKRLKPVEQLQKSLNGRVSSRNDNIKKLHDVVKEVAAMTPRLTNLELHTVMSNIGFTAKKLLDGKHEENSVIDDYRKVSCNAGNHFNKSTGTFTAPRDGLYVSCLSICLMDDCMVQAAVRLKKSGGAKIHGDPVCETTAEVKNSTSCAVGVVEMKTGDVLFAWVFHNAKSDNWKILSFACFGMG